MYVIIKKTDLEKMDEKIKQLVVNPMNVQLTSSTPMQIQPIQPKIEEIKKEEERGWKAPLWREEEWQRLKRSAGSRRLHGT